MLTLAACSGGSTLVPPTEPPVITAVTPTGAVGAAGSDVTFSATADGSPTSWQWTFGTGVSPQTSGDASPVITLVIPGTRTGTVVATNAVGSSAPFAFSFEVAPSDVLRIIAITPEIVAGNKGTQVQVSASVIGGPTAWAWDFGDVAVPQTSSEASPAIELTGHGRFRGRVVASNASRISDPFEFDIRITNLPPMPVRDVLASGDAGNIQSVEIALVAGRPVIGYQDELSVEVVIVQAQVAFPEVPTDWIVNRVEARQTPVVNIHEIDGRIAAFYFFHEFQHFGSIICAQALTDFPQGPQDWQVYTVSDHVSPAAVIDFGGRTTISGDGSAHKSYILQPSVGGIPGPGDWLKVEAPGDGELLPLGDHLGLVYWVAPSPGADLDDLVFSSTATPLDSGSWANHVALTLPLVVGLHRSSATVVDGKPVIGAVVSSFGTFGPSLRIMYANTPIPATASDWVVHPSGLNSLEGMSSIAGKLVALRELESGELGFDIAWDAMPIAALDWESLTIQDDLYAYPGDGGSLSVGDGDRLLVAYPTDTGLETIRVAMSPIGWEW